MDESKIHVHIGRVIFCQDKWVVQTLRSHVDNVARLAELWDNSRAFQGVLPATLALTRSSVVEAARIHDMAKPAHFQLEYKSDSRSRGEWGYSFRGHRFDAFHNDAYVQMLARLHHTYSVGDITKYMAQLKLDATTKTIAENLPLDLYALEMCDQIEATCACAVLGSDNPEERVFMDFQFRPRAEAEYELEPFAFSQAPIEFEVEYAELVPPRDKKLAVESVDENKRRAALREMRNWFVQELQTAPLQYRKVKLWPWI